MSQHYTLLLLLSTIFVATTNAISCLDYQKEQVGGTMKSTDTINIKCPNGTNYCVHVYREANDETLEIGGCADNTAETTTCNNEGCTKENQEETKTETCCCTTDYCDTARTSNSHLLTTLFTSITILFTNLF